MIPFLIIGGVGIVLLVLSLIVGDIFDSLDIGDGAISGTGLGVAAVLFGASGAITTSAGLEIWWAYIVAAVAAVLAYLLTQLVIRRLTASSDGVPADVTGVTGVATATISPSGGEVSLDGSHEIERRLAYSDDVIEQGTRIRVLEHSGTRVKVIADKPSFDPPAVITS